MEFRKTILVLTITIVFITVIMFGVSYGWYAYSNASSNVAGSTIKETPTVIFNQTEYISSSKTMPIYDEDRYTYATKNSFNLTMNKNLKDYEIGVEISLTNIAIAEELKIPNYKYELLQDNVVVSSGNFSTLGTSTTLNILPMTIIEPSNYPQTYNYELYIWLKEDGTNQNNLMNKGLSAKINVSSALKKKNS